MSVEEDEQPKMEHRVPLAALGERHKIFRPVSNAARKVAGSVTNGRRECDSFAQKLDLQHYKPKRKRNGGYSLFLSLVGNFTISTPFPTYHIG